MVVQQLRLDWLSFCRCRRPSPVDWWRERWTCCLRGDLRKPPTAACGAIDRGLLSWSRLQGRRQHDQRWRRVLYRVRCWL